MEKNIKFGTDGWRGLIGDELNIANIRRAAQAFADYVLIKGRHKKVVIGYDGRVHSSKFAREFAEVLNGNLIETLLSEQITPTPVVSYYCRYEHCEAGVMITASHNPPEYNGVKFKTAGGSPFATEETAVVESLIDKNPIQRSPYNINKINLLYNYYRHLEKLIDFEAIRDAGLFVAVDSMAGAGRTILEEILVMHGISAKTIFSQATPNFSGRMPEPIEKNLQPLSDFMKSVSFSVGFATDGDADRLGVITDKGKWLNIQESILYIADYYINRLNTKDDIIKTASVTEKLRKVGSKHKLNVIDVPVGFKYVSEAMIDHRAAFGAEESGGFGFKEHLPDRDGIFSALLFLEMLAKSGHDKLENFIREKRAEYGKIFYDRIDMVNDNDERHKILPELSETPPDTIAGFRVNKTSQYTNSRGMINGLKLYSEGNTRWLLIRVSETEPIVRIYAEGQSTKEVQELLVEGQKLMEHR